MINKLKIFAVGLLGTVAALSANAKQPAAASTAVLQTVNVALTAYTQGASSTSRSGVVHNTIAVGTINTKAIITALTGGYQAGDLLVRVTPLTNYTVTAVTTNGTGTNTTYSTNSTLITTNLASYYEVVKGNSVNAVLTNAGTGLTITTVTVPGLTNDASVRGQVIKEDGQITSGNTIAVREIAVASSTWTLTLFGLDRSTTIPVSVQTGSGATVVNSSDANYSVSGAGYNGVVTNNTPAVVTGTVSVHFWKKE